MVGGQTYRAYRFIYNDLAILTAQLQGIHQCIRLTVRCEWLCDVLNCLVIIDLRQINGICWLARRAYHLYVLDIVAERGKVLLWFHICRHLQTIWYEMFTTFNTQANASEERRKEFHYRILACLLFLVFDFPSFLWAFWGNLKVPRRTSIFLHTIQLQWLLKTSFNIQFLINN